MNVHPALPRVVAPVHSTVILMINYVRGGRVDCELMDASAVLRVLVRLETSHDILVLEPPALASIVSAERSNG